MWEKPSPSMAQGYNISQLWFIFAPHGYSYSKSTTTPTPMTSSWCCRIGLLLLFKLYCSVISSCHKGVLVWYGVLDSGCLLLTRPSWSWVWKLEFSDFSSFRICLISKVWESSCAGVCVHIIKINYHVHVCYMYLGIMSEWERERETTIPWTSVIPIVAVPSSDSVYTLLPDVTTLPIAWHTQWKIYWAPLHIHAIHMYTYIHVHVQCTSFCSNRCFNVLFSSFRVFLSSSVALSWTLADLKSSWRFAT